MKVLYLGNERGTFNASDFLFSDPQDFKPGFTHMQIGRGFLCIQFTLQGKCGRNMEKGRPHSKTTPPPNKARSTHQRHRSRRPPTHLAPPMAPNHSCRTIDRNPSLIHNKIIYDGHLTNCIQSRQRPAAVPQEPPTHVGEEQSRQPICYNIISSNTFLYYMFCLALLLMFIPHLMVLLGIWQIHEYCMLCIWFGNIMYVQSAKERDLLEPINLT